MMPMRDDPSSALSGLVSVLLGGRLAPGHQTHEVIVHSPGSVMNGGNNLAKAASMSELVRILLLYLKELAKWKSPIHLNSWF